MKWNNSNKTRLIIGVILAFALLIIFIMMFRLSKSQRVHNEINPRIHADMKSGLTYDDMMKYRKKSYYNTRKSDYEIETEEDRNRQDSIINAQYNAKINKIDEMEPKPQKPKPKPVPKKADTVVVIAPQKKPRSRFFTPTEQKEVKNTIKLVIHGEQIVHQSSTIKMRLLEDMTLEDYTIIPKGTYIYGVVSIGQERINITVQNVRFNNMILPVNKVVYDRDGMMGLYVPMSLPSEAVKEGVSEGASQMQYTERKNIIESTSSAIVTAGRRIFMKNNRIEKVTVKSNYMLYLKDQEK